jgi:hypothetical protein
MTFWATLYYAGVVVLTMGSFETLDQCQELTSRMESDIFVTYTDPSPALVTGPFPTNEFTATCETQQLDTGTQLKEL